MDIPLLHFRFLGGNVTSQDIGSTTSCAAFDDVCEDLVGIHPDIFPSECAIPPDDVDLVTVDVPLEGEGGIRMHCVYFQPIETVSRPFWNVFCFSYRSSDVSEEMRQTLLEASADEWYQALRYLPSDSRSFRLEVARHRQPKADFWSGQGCYIQSFPMPDGGLTTCAGTDIDWRRKLQLPRPKPSREERTKLSLLPTQAHSSKTLPPRRKSMIFLSCLLFLLIGGGLGWYVTDAAQAWKDVKLAEQAQMIQQLQAQLRKTELLLQQKATSRPPAPVSEPDAPFSAAHLLPPGEEPAYLPSRGARP